MRMVRAGGLSLHVADEGDPAAPAVVFANALGCDLRVWDAVLPLLPAGLRLVRCDKRGHGLSDAAAGPYGIADLADDLAAILDALGVAGAVVVGLSVGGMIAQALAQARPDLVGALVLSGTAPKIGTAAVWDERIALVERGGVAALAEGTLERWFTPAFRADATRLAPWRNMLVRCPVDGYVATCRAIRDADLTEVTRAIGQPTLAMAGDRDGSTPPDLVRACAELIPGARFALIEGAGHIPGVERPEAVAALIAGFLAETGRL